MPVITRSQSKMLNVQQKKANITMEICYKIDDNFIEPSREMSNVQQKKANVTMETCYKIDRNFERNFIEQSREMLDDLSRTRGQINRIVRVNLFYQTMNRILPSFIEDNKKRWFKFSVAMFNKSYDIENDMVEKESQYEFDKLIEEFVKFRKLFYEHYTKAKEHIAFTA